MAEVQSVPALQTSPPIPTPEVPTIGRDEKGRPSLVAMPAAPAPHPMTLAEAFAWLGASLDRKLTRADYEDANQALVLVVPVIRSLRVALDAWDPNYDDLALTEDADRMRDVHAFRAVPHEAP